MADILDGICKYNRIHTVEMVSATTERTTNTQTIEMCDACAASWDKLHGW